MRRAKQISVSQVSDKKTSLNRTHIKKKKKNQLIAKLDKVLQEFTGQKMFI